MNPGSKNAYPKVSPVSESNVSRSNSTYNLPGNSAGKAKPSENFRLEPPNINLPTGGGAIRGIEEKLEVNAVSGSALFALPIPLTPGRKGFTPQLSLHYNSSAGNGPFGLGWNLEVPAIARKTDRCIPKYLDKEESDTFIFSGVQDLVPLFVETDEGWKKYLKQHQENGITYTVKRYRPRIEGLFARIEKWENNASGEVHWRSITKENLTSYYGFTAESRISDPSNPLRVFSWLLCKAFDDRGDIALYIYKREDLIDIPERLCEKNRIEVSSQLYLKKVMYGNRTPYYNGDTTPSDENFLFQVVLDYGEHPTNSDIPANIHQEQQAWKYRKDSFSTCRPGFELRTYRRCCRILIFHCFDTPGDLPISPYLVKSTELFYDDMDSEAVNEQSDVGFSYLIKCRQNAHRWDEQLSHYFTKSLPDFDVSYQPLEWNTSIQVLDAENSRNLPAGFADKQYLWIDLFSEGISGILTEQGEGWFYTSNLGNGNFAASKSVVSRPSFAGLNEGVLQLQELEGNGIKYLVQFQNEPRGFFKLSEDSAWTGFKCFENLPATDLENPNARFVDLDGDGISDLLISEERSLKWYLSAGEKGFQIAKTTACEVDEEKGPAILFADQNQTIFLSDMNGDGLTDIARIRNGEICYWPNLGYGKFGPKVCMEDSPLFDHPNQFNPSFLRLADIDGSGTTDIIYLSKDELRIWMNQNGNSWSKSPRRIASFPVNNEVTDISICDFLGKGTSCLVYSSPLPAHAQHSLQYIDLMGNKKPHLLASYRNNCGKVVSLEYKSSTYYYLEDKKNGKPWITRLPFPVHVIARKELYDSVSQLRFSSSYFYHHGYYDVVEKEFRGFGRVDQLDTELYEHFKKQDASNIVKSDLHQPPVLTKTWFHTGAFFNKEKIINYFRNADGSNNEFFLNNEFNEHFLPETVVTDEKGNGLENPPVAILREAASACKSMLLRQEVYALDGSVNENLPYSVLEQNYQISVLQPHAENPFAVFLVTESESISYNYERQLQDPRVSQTITLKTDEYGNIEQSVSINYGRMLAQTALPEEVRNAQQDTHLLFTEFKYTNDIDQQDSLRLRMLAETCTYELRGVQPVSNFFSVQDLANQIPGAQKIPYHAAFTSGTVQLRKLLLERVIYSNSELLGPLPLYQQEARGITYEKFKLAYTDQLLLRLYGDKVTEEMMVNGGYKKSSVLKVLGIFPSSDEENHWWIPSGRMKYPSNASAHFYQPNCIVDPFGKETTTFFEPKYQLHIERTLDPLQNEINITRFDYRLLVPLEMKDMNDNLTEVVFDALGMVAGTALKGKGNEAGDLLGFKADLTESEIDQFLNNPISAGANLLQHASTRFVYDLRKQPMVAACISRETHHPQSVNTGIPSPLRYTFEYTSGSGQLLMKKVQTEPGIAAFIDVDDTKKFATANPRWIGNGRTILNNKGNPVKQYEPYFSTSHFFENDKRLTEIGYAPIVYYDALGRKFRTEKPNGTFTRLEYNSWQQKVFDENDNVKDCSWFVDRITGSLSSIEAEKEAAEKSAIHYDTPGITYLDSLNRVFYSITQNAFVHPSTQELMTENYAVFVDLDIEGNQRFIRDARNNKVMEYDYDMLGRKSHVNSMDAGESWIFSDITDQPIFNRNSSGYSFRYEYDELRRPVRGFMKKDIGPEHQLTETIYGQNSALEKQTNCCGQTIEQRDGSGISRNLSFDFEGNLLSSQKQLLINFQEEVNWTTIDLNTDLESTLYETSSVFNAIGKPIQIKMPDNSIVYLQYNINTLLQNLKLELKGSGTVKEYVRNISYNEYLDRESILYGNDVVTRYTYEAASKRLIKLLTTANNGTDILQELHYVFDPAGNIMQIEDKAQQTQFFNNAVVNPVTKYTYDAVYRLIQANGREHVGQQPQPQDNWNDFPRLNLQHKHDGSAMREYTQQYKLDAVGNILELKHIANGGNFTRVYEYEQTSNRLRSTSIGNDDYPYSYNEAGGFNSMPHLQQLEWNSKGELTHADLGGGGKAWYVYNIDGDRTRKIVEHSNGLVKETIYLGAMEIYRERLNNEVRYQRESLHVMDDGGKIALIETKTIDTNDNELLNEPLSRYQFGNHLGSASLELDDSARIISYEEYHPYGTTSFQAVNKTIKAASKRYRYIGKERDEETGLSYHGARYYASWIGRWISPDPIGVNDGVNLYAYVSGNPVMKIDTTGFQGMPLTNAGKYRREKVMPNSQYLAGEDCTSESYSIDMDRTMCVFYSTDPPVQIAPTIPEPKTAPKPKSTPKPKSKPKKDIAYDDPNFQVTITKIGLYEEIALGEMYDGPPTVLGTLGGIAVSLIPVVDTACDIRDIMGTHDRMKKDPSAQNKFAFGMAVVGGAPLVGSVLVGLWKGKRKLAKTAKLADAADDILHGFDKIEDFKKSLKAGDAAADLSKSTFARLTIEGEEIFGNAISTAGRSKEDLDMMRDLLKKTFGKTTTNATIQHAEADALLEAYSKGIKAEKAVMHVDRDLCDFCYRSLKNVLPLVGIKELTIFTKKGDYLITYTIKATQ